MVERFRDEIGDWRLCILSPYGGRVHAAWGLALAAKIRDERDLEADAIWSDDGIVIHLPDADEPPPADLVLIEPDEIEDLIVGELSGSALFGARFRENASRSLLIPRAYPGKRTPLWQQRLKSQSLLEVARDFPRFPVILETYRECLQRRPRPAGAAPTCCASCTSRQISLVEVETPTASPFASSLLFDYVATYMYEGDTPNAERRAAALALDRDLLRELLGQEELRELIDPEALEEVEAQLQHRTEAGRAGDRDALQQLLRNLGDLTAEECDERVAEGYSAASMLEKLVAERRVAKVRIAGEERYIAAEDAGLYRDALGVPPPGRPAGDLPRGPPGRDARPGPPLRPHPRPLPDRAARRAATASTRRRRCASSRPKGRWSAASCCRAGPSASGATPKSCAGSAAPASRACARRSRRPTATELARFLPSWQNVDAFRRAGAGLDRLREALVPLQGVALTPKVWEARRAAAPARRLLAEPGSTSSAPAASWSGSAPAPSAAPTAASPSTSARTSASPGRRRPTPSSSAPSGEVHDAIRERLAAGPSFWLDLLADLDHPAEELHNALWDLAWTGEVTNDAFAPLRAPRLRAVPPPSAPAAASPAAARPPAPPSRAAGR